ncbi:hypothetical protein [uncultured Veillonella sp.]|uniref:hypothetical protein n=1 Tax=uncultured Veillonella sp. TaxID=159268 RepID=UPI002600BB57|nr:hypothetical protein [uncultured Veillonella sp.]MDY3973249.1 hypothetical protein [Veillonella caviae]
MASLVTQQELANYVENLSYDEISAQEFYRHIFPEGVLGTLDGTDGKPLGILVFKDANGKAVNHVAIADDLEALTSQVGQAHRVLAPIAYFGDSELGGKASFLRALTVDIEITSIDELKRVLLLLVDTVPLNSTFFVLTGNHIQIYYLYKEGRELTGSAQKDLLEQKKQLINKYNESLQLTQPIKVTPLAQTLPMVGSLQESAQDEVKAYRLDIKFDQPLIPDKG